MNVYKEVHTQNKRARYFYLIFMVVAVIGLTMFWWVAKDTVASAMLAVYFAVAFCILLVSSYFAFFAFFQPTRNEESQSFKHLESDYDEFNDENVEELVFDESLVDTPARQQKLGSRLTY